MRFLLEHAWFKGAPWLPLFTPLEWLFRSAVGLRRACYHLGFLRSYRAPVPVVVVGNLSVGGNGKTPVVIALARALMQQGLRVGIVSRGHGARVLRGPHRVTGSSTPDECGDEAMLIHRRTGCPCVTARSRAEAVRFLLTQDAVDIIVSDDGLQHYALARDMEIIVYDLYRGFGNGRCLPAGPLREPLARLAGAAWVLSRGIDANSDVPLEPECLVNLETQRSLPFSAEAVGASVYAVAGIGSPEGFMRSLQARGFTPAAKIFPDHHCFTAADFLPLQDRPIIMTEKDAVKCVGLAGSNAWFLRVSARLPERLIDDALALIHT
ncbi:MAG: tetraacyldisaccharide 4'-kinase [Halioglobus sp.]|nr:tetraacyldisaccharide 4'-kinase [Halioglobus sp.]